MNENSDLYGHLCGSTVNLGTGAKEIIYDTGFFGRPKNDCLELTFIESVYLHYKGRITVELDGKDLDLENLIYKVSRRMDNFEVKYIVYKDLRERGYYIKPGVTDFRVYPRGGRPGSTPSKYFVQALSERQILPLPQLIRQVETSDNLKKEMILAVVDEESDIRFGGSIAVGSGNCARGRVRYMGPKYADHLRRLRRLGAADELPGAGDVQQQHQRQRLQLH